MNFNEKMQSLRKQKGLTQQDLAEKLFVSRTAVSKWESEVSQS
jgi:transcriptional regulator with XRE-family HTH domain